MRAPPVGHGTCSSARGTDCTSRTWWHRTSHVEALEEVADMRPAVARRRGRADKGSRCGRLIVRADRRSAVEEMIDRRERWQAEEAREKLEGGRVLVGGRPDVRALGEG